MSRSLKLLLILVAGLAMLAGCSNDTDNEGGTDPPTEPPTLAFVGSDACAACHTDIHMHWQDSGHPYKLTKIDGVVPTGQFPTFSAFPGDPVDPPAGYTWANVSYTIGGYGWKMRWIDDQGYIITQNDDTQYNFENQTRVAYHAGDAIGTKPYDCGKCHTTGWVADEDHDTDNDLTDNQDGLPGMHGTFFAGGVHCEQCHGMGSQHVYSRDFEMSVDSSSAFCGECHTRNADNSIAASGGYIKHHEQFDEWTHSPHNNSGAPGCNNCHDPHSSVKMEGDASGIGTTATCVSCHDDMELKHNGMPSCVDCHMPKASKSAIAVNLYQGDIKTHIWNINTAAEGKTDGMFNGDGSLVLEDGEGMAAVTLDFACYGCHRDADNVGGTFSPRTLQDLSDYVLGIGEYAGDGGIHSPTAPAVAGN